MPDFVPRQDTLYTAWLTQFVSTAADHAAALDLDGAQVTALQDVNSAWEASYQEHLTAQNAAKAATTVKNQTRKTSQDLVRGFVKQFQANPDIPDALRAQLGITIADDVASDIAPPTEPPMVSTTINARYQHQLVLRNTLGGKAKPQGSVAAEVWMAIVDDPEAPLTSEDLRFSGLATKGTFVQSFNGADVGRTAMYMTRWINRKGEHGPWSNTSSRTIAA